MLDDNIDLRHENEMLKKHICLMRREVTYLGGHLEVIREYSNPPTIDTLMNMNLSDNERSNDTGIQKND